MKSISDDIFIDKIIVIRFGKNIIIIATKKQIIPVIISPEDTVEPILLVFLFTE